MTICYRLLQTCRQPSIRPDNRHKKTADMARAETMENARETGAGANCPLPCRATCHVDPLCPLHTWPRLFTADTTVRPGHCSGVMHICRRHHTLPMQGLCMPLLSPHPEGQNDAQSPPCDQSQGPAAPRDFSGEQLELDREEHHRASSLQRPQPNMMAPNEPIRAPQRDAVPDLDVVEVVSQLRMIGDELNSSVLRRNFLGAWQELRGICRGLVSFIAHVLHTLCRPT
ncbi:bcl-2-binding component 3 [Pholidichthys leucotaenia]